MSLGSILYISPNAATNLSRPNPHNKSSIGQTEITYKPFTSILTKANGFMDTYDYTLNPYSGCAFGCTYCYAAFFARSKDLKDTWGYWVQVKENALSLLEKHRGKFLLHDKTIYMSSVTDPYQPIEKELQLTRSLLQELLHHQPRLVIQTRSPLVVRDTDLLKQFKHLQVNMTITTDCEKVRKIFEPLCPSNALRLNAIKELQEAGINTCLTLTPLLPLDSPEQFAKSLLATGIKKFIIQPFHSDKGKFVANTRVRAMQLIEDMQWTQEKYNQAVDIITQYIPEIGIGKQGFQPI